MEAFTEDVGNDPPWEEKTDSRLLWVSRVAACPWCQGLMVPVARIYHRNLVCRTSRME